VTHAYLGIHRSAIGGTVVPPKKIEVTIKLRLDTFQFDVALTITKAIYSLLKSCPEVISVSNISIRKP
jgi:hypothetical protein